MKFVVESPVIHVAHLNTVKDLEWLFVSLQEGELFTELKYKHEGNEKRWLTLGNHFLHVDVEKGYVSAGSFGIVARLGSFAAWNQAGVVYVLPLKFSTGKEHVFDDRQLPKKLLRNVLVKE